MKENKFLRLHIAFLALFAILSLKDISFIWLALVSALSVVYHYLLLKRKASGVIDKQESKLWATVFLMLVALAITALMYYMNGSMLWKESMQIDIWKALLGIPLIALIFYTTWKQAFDLVHSPS